MQSDRLPTDRIRASEARNTGSIPVGRTIILAIGSRLASPGLPFN